MPGTARNFKILAIYAHPADICCEGAGTVALQAERGDDITALLLVLRLKLVVVRLEDHGVYVLRGTARVLMGREVVEVVVGDVIYIPPNERHQFENIGDEPFGFLCAVPLRD